MFLRRASLHFASLAQSHTARDVRAGEILKASGLSVRDVTVECVSREPLKTIALHTVYQFVLVFEYRKNMFNGGISTTLNSYVLIVILHA